MIFILIQIKFNIDINYDELENHMKTYEKKSWSSLVVRSNAEPKYAEPKKPRQICTWKYRRRFGSFHVFWRVHYTGKTCILTGPNVSGLH
jgi:hypothetical protein